MERDYVGLGSKGPPITVKEEVPDVSKDSVAMTGSGMNWSFSRQVSSVPQFLSFKSSVDESPRKTILDPISSSGFMTISTPEAFDSSQKPYGGTVQKNVTHDKQAASNHRMASYDTVHHYKACPAHHPQEVRTFPVNNQQNQTITISMSAPVLQSHLGSSGHNVVGNPISAQPLGAVPVVTPVSVLSPTNSIVGTTDLSSKASVNAAQLTIFYGGSVCVYDDISPEKAQAIMLLAGTGASPTQNKSVQTTQTRAPPVPKPSIGDCYTGNRNLNMPLCSGLVGPISVTPCSPSELSIGKPVVALASSVNQTEASKPIISVGPVSSALVPAVAVPQARKASLARFLEKRKERVMCASPYNASKKSLESSAPGSDCMSLSVSCSSSKN
ncbi:hypothetical protein K2173_026416 [Erythroxylum novogranatense]|uniref:Protein TIFY n=1 Tax=Erythroxylum novogranatense TaxID=1862640 RepID=A0AAV8SNY6_9ROSI|nr:hypothetical protein K2173_026416 [Erythroxylum novogranatense]